jgi:histidinol-phosphate phosphatase family protein
MNAVILAGGRGTRLASRTNGLPKPLASVQGKPLLAYQFELLARHHVEQVTVLCGYGAEAIHAFCGDGSQWGLQIECIDESRPLGTAGAVLEALDRLPERFLVLYGDTMVNADLDRFWAAHETSRAAATLFLHPNDHPQDSDLAETGSDGGILAFHPYPHPAGALLPNQVNAALYVIEAKALRGISHSGQPLDFGKHVFPEMLARGLRLQGYRSPEYIRDAGTPERLDRVAADVASGLVAQSSLDVPRPAVLLDRDGTINEEVSYIRRPEQFRLIPGAAQGIRLLRQAGYRIAVVTNQPVVARGECTFAELERIHNFMEMELSAEGAFVDRIYFCPHHPHSGYPGEVRALKIECNCRKPRGGLVEQAARELNLDLECSWLIGDSTGDLETARVCGLRSILLRTGIGGIDGKYPARPAGVCDDLLAAARFIIKADSAGKAAFQAGLQGNIQKGITI